MISKADFIRSLQGENKGLSPYDVSQRVRLAHGCVSVYQADSELSVEDHRGYMIRWREKRDRTADNPELYICVISTQQSKAWQDVTWIKEILQILDPPSHRTDTPEKLKSMLANRHALTPNGHDTPHNVVADKAGLILALGAAIPYKYRRVLREQDYLSRYEIDELEHMLLIPNELVGFLLGADFEAQFNTALASCSAPSRPAPKIAELVQHPLLVDGFKSPAEKLS